MMKFILIAILFNCYTAQANDTAKTYLTGKYSTKYFIEDGTNQSLDSSRLSTSIGIGYYIFTWKPLKIGIGYEYYRLALSNLTTHYQQVTGDSVHAFPLSLKFSPSSLLGFWFPAFEISYGHAWHNFKGEGLNNQNNSFYTFNLLYPIDHIEITVSVVKFKLKANPSATESGISIGLRFHF